jgi:hypothetical protein
MIANKTCLLIVSLRMLSWYLKAGLQCVLASLHMATTYAGTFPRGFRTQGATKTSEKNPQSVQVRGSVKTSPGQVLLPVAVPGQNTWGQFVSPLFKHTRTLKLRSLHWDSWVIHSMELILGRGAAPGSPCSVKAPVRRHGAHGPGLGFQPEPGCCFAWGSSLSVQVGNLGQGLLLFLPESASHSIIYSNRGHTNQGLCCLLSSFLPSRQTGIWVVQSVMR